MNTNEILRYTKITLSSAIPLLAYYYYVFCDNRTNHSAASPYFLLLYFIPIAYLSIIKIRDNNKEWIIPLLIAVVGVINITVFDQMNVMKQYDSWAHSGMPKRPSWSQFKLCK